MRLWGWRRRRNAGDDEFPEGLDAASAWDEQLSAYLDGELDEHEAVAVEDALADGPALAVQLDELRVVRDALGSLGELRAPRPFTLEAPPTAARGAPGRLEMVFRMGAVAAAVAFAVVLTGDFVGLGDDGVEGWGISRPRFGSSTSEQASDSSQEAAALSVATTAPTPALAAAATQTAVAAPTATPVVTAAAAPSTPTATASPTAAATAAPTATTAAALAAAPAESPAPEADASSTDGAAPEHSAASPPPTIDAHRAARGVEPTAAPTAAAQTEAEAGSAEAAPAADAAADEDDSADAAEAAPPAAATAAAPAAAPAPAATATPAPAIRDEPIEGEAAGGDGGAAAMRTAEQGLLLAAVALAILAFALGRRRGSGA